MALRVAVSVTLVAAVACGSRSLGGPGDASLGTGGAASDSGGGQGGGASAGAGGCPSVVCYPECINDDFIQSRCTPQGTWECPAGSHPWRSCPRDGTGGSGPVVYDAGGPPDAAGRFDAGVDETPFDAGSCDCAIRADGALTMSWGCFVRHFGDGSPELGWCGAPGRWTSGCGLDVFTYDRQGLLQLFVYDKQGNQVGIQYQNSDTAFECPTDPTMTSLTIASGSFPPSSCATTLCACSADRTTITCSPSVAASATTERFKHGGRR
jgi:hypothetical protein